MDKHITNVISMRELLTFYYKNRCRLLLAFCLPFILAVEISFIPAPRYKATSVLTVRMGSEYVYQPEVGSAPNTQQNSIPFERDEIFKAEVAILSSDDLHKEVVKELGTYTLFPELSEDAAASQSSDLALSMALKKFNKQLDVNLEKESSVITVSYDDKDPDHAVKAIDLLLQLYMEKRKSLYLEPRVEMAKTHAAEARRHVLAAENALEAFKHSHEILSFESERQALITQRSEIQRQTASVSSAGLEDKLAYFEDKLNNLNKDEAQFNALNHDVTVANDEYAVFAHRLNEATAYEDVEHERAGSVRIIQPPSVPAEPKKLQPYILAAGFVLSLLSTLIMALLINFFSSGFLTPEQLSDAVGLPVLAVLPLRKKKARR
jgi:uncharacterized protein involved in exopolysaccharide biosynthesis